MRLARITAPLAALLLAGHVVDGPADGFKTIGTRIRIEDCRTAVAKTRPGKVVKVEYKWRKQRLVYEFEVADRDGLRWELECDGYSGQLIETEREVPSADDPLFAAKRVIALEEAQRIALRRYPGTIVETEYEIESDGDATYEFDIVSGREGREWKIEVDAGSGRIIEDGEEEFHQIGQD
jgi:uncharacterized membrane protein YkoI